MRTVVIGGGLAGITAALDLADAGMGVTLLEVRPRLGGAVSSFSRGGLRLDNGQHVFLRCCDRYRALLRRLGSEGGTHLQPRLEIPVLRPGGRVHLLRRDRLPAPAHLARALLGFSPLTVRERAGAVRAALALQRVGEVVHDEPLGDWLARHGQAPHAVDALWDLIALPTLNLRAREASLALGAFVLRTGLLSDPAAGDIGFHVRPLAEIVGEPAERALGAAGVEVRLGTGVRAPVDVQDGALSVASAEGPLLADAVVLAVPHDRVEGLLPAGALPPGARPAAMGSSPIVNLHLLYDRPVTDLPFAAGIESPVQYLFARGAGNGLPAGRLIGVSLSGADREMAESPARLRERFVPAVAELLPGAREARLEAFHVSREHAATFRATPGVQALRPGPRTALPGLVLAGAYTATGWPATMEGAVRSGHAAASELLAGRASLPEAVAA